MRGLVSEQLLQGRLKMLLYIKDTILSPRYFWNYIIINPKTVQPIIILEAQDFVQDYLHLQYF